MTAKLHALLQSRSFYTLFAVLLTFIYWWSGLSKMLHFDEALAEMQHFNLQPTWLFAALTIGVQLAGSLLLITASRWAWLGAGALGVFTLSTVPLAHRFWEMDGLAATLELALVQEHFSMLGGLALAAALASFHNRRTISQAVAEPR